MRGVIRPRQRSGRGVWLAVLLTVALIVPLVAQESVQAQPAAVEVVNLNDSGAGSLRQAIVDVATGGEITFAAGLSGTITLTSRLEIERELTITGPGAEVIALSGGDTTQVILVRDNPEVVITGVTIRDGNATDSGSGGGMFVGGRVTLSHSVVTSNSAGLGGGLHVEHGWLIVTDSSISGNTAQFGGGLFNFSGPATLINSAVTGNTALQHGGGIYANGDPGVTLIDSAVTGNTAGSGGGIWNNGQLPLTGSTVAGNTAGNDGGGIYNNVGSVSLESSTLVGNRAGLVGGGAHTGTSGNSRFILTNSTVAGNTSSSAGSGLYWDTSGTVQATGSIVTGPDDTALVCNITIPGTYNLSGDANCFVDNGKNLLDTDPLLEPLADNGGPTETMLPGPGSPVINAIPAEACALDEEDQLLPDQRGVSRPQGGACDIGAVELTLAEQWTRLQEDVHTGSIPVHLKPRLLAFLNAADLARERGQTSVACYTLQTFSQQVGVLSPRYIAAEVAGEWQRHVQTTRLLIGCS